MELILAPYCEARLRSTKQLSQKGLREVYKEGRTIDLYYGSMFPAQLPDGTTLYSSQYVSAQELKGAGVKSILVRYNQHRKLATLEL